MNWLQCYRLRHKLRNSIWVFPVLGTLAAIALVRLLHWVEEARGWVSPLDPDTARGMLGTVASALLTSIVFICSALLLVVQLASASLTPRAIGMVFRDSVTKFVLALLVFCFTFCLSAQLRIRSDVPLLTAHLAAYVSLAGLGIFFYLIDHLGKMLRPSGVLRLVSQGGCKAIEQVYPQRLADLPAQSNGAAPPVIRGKPILTVASSDFGVVMAFDEKGLLALAQRASCVIELVPQVGDHVAIGDPLFRIYSEGSSPPAQALCASVAVGQERTIEQDATLAFRIVVDIALKALSPAINDPTTAVLVLDQIHHLLRKVGHRHLDTGMVHDAAGQLRLVYRTPDWEDFVRLAVTEIRHFGVESIQVARRLRAMLENLIGTLPEGRTVLLRQELGVLQRSAERFFSEPEDRAMAEVSDSQGVGGKRETVLN